MAGEISTTTIKAVSFPKVVPTANAGAPKTEPELTMAQDTFVSTSKHAAGTLQTAEEANTHAADLDGLNETQLKAVVAACQQKLQQTGLAPAAQAEYLYQSSGASALMAKKGIDQMANGKRAFLNLQKAVGLDPHHLGIATAYARPLLIFNDLNSFKRFFVEGALGIDTKKESQRAFRMLGEHAGDPLAQLLKQRLADAIRDQMARQEAEARIKELEQSNPEGMRVARKSMEGDASLKDTIKN